MMLPNENMLSSLMHQSGVVTRQISPENPTGEKGKACLWNPDPDDPFLVHSGPATDLGRGWKVRPFIALKSHETAVLADIEGPGCINQFWITSNLAHYRCLILRMYWDDETTPSVEVPLGDFFAMGHDLYPHLVNSIPVNVGPHRACQCYWQMPFRKRARITLENDGPEDAHIIAYKMLYKLHPIADDIAYFHAQWRRSQTQRDYPEHVILSDVTGSGVYVGTSIAWTAFSRGWWGEGEVKFFLDGDQEFPTIADTGTEDYFGGAWCYYKDGKNPPEQAFSAPYCGLPLATVDDANGPRRYSLYRWHIVDAIGFSENLKVTIQTLGWWPYRKYQPLTDDLASVAYWYQREPHQPFPAFPVLSARWTR